MSCALCQMPREDPTNFLCDACRELSEAGAGLMSLSGDDDTESVAFSSQWEHLDGRTVFVIALEGEIMPRHADAARDAAMDAIIESLGGAKVFSGRSDSNNGGN